VIAPTKLSADRTVGCYFSLEKDSEGVVRLIPRGPEWVLAHQMRGAKKAFLVTAAKKRRQDEFKENLKKLKAGDDIDDPEFKELYAEVLGKPPPKSVKEVESVAGIQKVPAKEADGAQVVGIPYVPGPVSASAPTQILRPFPPGRVVAAASSYVASSAKEPPIVRSSSSSSVASSHAGDGDDDAPTAPIVWFPPSPINWRPQALAFGDDDLPADDVSVSQLTLDAAPIRSRFVDVSASVDLTKD